MLSSRVSNCCVCAATFNTGRKRCRAALHGGGSKRGKPQRKPGIRLKYKRAQRATFLNLTFHQNTRTQEARAASKAGPQRCNSQPAQAMRGLKIEQVTSRPVPSAKNQGRSSISADHQGQRRGPEVACTHSHMLQHH